MSSANIDLIRAHVEKNKDKDRATFSIAGIKELLAAMPAGDASPVASPLVGEDAVEHMVQRFLQWKLPEDFYPDCGISFDRSYRSTHGPVGTNLFTATQAKAMILHILEGLHSPVGGQTDLPVAGETPEQSGFYRILADSEGDTLDRVGSALSHPAPTERQGIEQAVEITDAMIAAGMEHYSEGGCSGLADYERREVVQSIIAAALASLNLLVREGWQPLTHNDDKMTCPMPADETVVEVMLNDGTVMAAWYSCNIMEAGDWDFLPVKDDGEPDTDAESIAAKIVAWRSAPLVAAKETGR